MANNQQITRLIRQIVQEEIQKVLPSLIVETFSHMMSEAVSTVKSQPRTLREASYINSEDEFDDYPDIKNSTVRPNVDRSRLAALMGYGDQVPPQSKLIVDTTVSEHGVVHPVDVSQVPDHVVKALTRDYTDVMNALKKKNG